MEMSSSSVVFKSTDSDARGINGPPYLRSAQIEVFDIENQASTPMQDLSPADEGLAAWRVLCAAFVFEALLWGNS